LVRTDPAPEARLLRAAYHAGQGRADLAEQDYRALAESATTEAGYAVLGEFYAQASRIDEAVAAWQQGLTLYPGALELKRGLAKGLLVRGRAGDRERIGALLAELLRQIPDDADLLWASARYELGRGTPAGAQVARAALDRAARALPADAETYRRLAELAFSELREPALARDLARRGLEANPGDGKLLLEQARAELALNQLDVARQLARSVLARDSQNAAAHEVLVAVARQRRDAAELQRELAAVQELSRIDRESVAFQLLVARIQAALGDSDAARATLADVPASAPAADRTAALLLRLELERSKGDFAAARQTLDAAGELAANNTDVLSARLQLLADERRFDDLLATVRDAPVQGVLRVEIMLSAARRVASSPAHIDQAVQLCRECIELAPQSVGGHLLLGELTYGKGDLSAAEQSFRAAIKLDPACAEARNNLAWILAQGRANYDEALEQARKAVELRPDDASFRDTLGFVLKSAGKLEDARDEFRQSVRLAAEGTALRARALFRLAQVSALLGDGRSIADYLKEALAVDQRGSVFTSAEKTEIARLLEAARPQ
jgi:tetratricopeptide (TPR) repeat protein